MYFSSFLLTLSLSLIYSLPLGVLAIDKRLENANDLLESSQPGLELLVELVLRGVLADLLVEIGTLWAVAHGGGEDLLDNEVVVGLEGLAIGVRERGGELLAWVLGIGAECLGHEVKATG